MELFNAILILLTRYSHGVHHETTLSATHTSADDQSIAILVNTEHVNASSNKWHLNPQSQASYDLLLTLNNQWSFHPNITSQIALELDGYTPDRSRNDSELLMVFSADNYKYFSVVIRLDTQNTLWKYYPASKVLATANDVYNDIISGDGSLRGRWDRLSDNDKWSNILPKYKKPLQWPLSIQITNNPTANTLQYECRVNNAVLRIEWDDAFIADQTNIYIMNDASDGKPIDIYSIKAQYTDSAASDVMTTTTAMISTTEYEIAMSTTAVLTSETTALSETGTQTPTQTEIYDMDSTDGTMIQLEAFRSHSDAETAALGIKVVIAIAFVCFAVLFVLGIWYYYKKKEEMNSPHSVNKSEYHTPPLDLSNTDIENILEKKRKESTQYGVGFTAHAAYTTQSIVPIKSNESDEDDTDTDKFIED